MDIGNLIAKKFWDSEVKTSLWNGGDIHKANVDFSFTHNKKLYKFTVRYEQAIRIPMSQECVYKSDNIEVESGIWLYDSPTSSYMVNGFQEVFPEIDKKFDDWLQARMFELLKEKTNFTQKDLYDRTEARRRAVKQFKNILA